MGKQRATGVCYATENGRVKMGLGSHGVCVLVKMEVMMAVVLVVMVWW